MNERNLLANTYFQKKSVIYLIKVNYTSYNYTHYMDTLEWMDVDNEYKFLAPWNLNILAKFSILFALCNAYRKMFYP